MRKKLVSIALAFMLACGYSGNALSAGDAYSDASKFRQEVLNNNNLNADKTALNVLSIDEMDKNLLIGKITSVMHYKVGQLVAIQERDGSIALYDAGGYRATLSETEDGSGKFEITNMQLRYTDVDWDAVKKDGATQWLGDYLASLGFDEGSGGAHAIGDKMGETIINFLQEKGLNSSFSFAPDATGNLRCTLNYDGKPQNTFDSNGDLSAEWIYDKTTGALQQSIVYSYSVATEKEPEKWIATVTYYNDRGMETSSFRCDVIDETTGDAFKKFPTKYHLDYDKQVQTTVYEYDKNGSKIAERDLEKNNVTYYGYGKPIETVHINPDTGHKSVTARYTYYAGGTLRTIINFNNSTGVQESVYVYSPKGAVLGVGTTQDPETLFKQLDTAYNMIKNLNSHDAADNLLKYLYNNGITQINLTAQDLSNPYVYMTFFLDEQQQSEVEAKMAALGEGTTPQAAIDAIIAEYKQKGEDASDAAQAYKIVKEMYDVLSKQKRPFQVKIESGQSTHEVEDPTRRETELQDRRAEGKVAGREHVADYDKDGHNVDLSGGIPSGTAPGDLQFHGEGDNKGQYMVDEVTYGYFEEYLDKTLKFSFEYDDPTTPGVRKTASNLRTVSSEKTGEVKREVEGTRETYYYDPAVVGQAQAFVDADGNILNEDAARQMIANGQQVYIQLNPQSINMFDGAGFKDIVNPKDGEQIFVAVEDMAMFDTFKGAVGTGAQVMVVGVVTNDIDGKMTMQVYNTTNGAGVGFGLDSTGNKGYAIGNQVGGMIDEIDRLSKEEGSWVYKNTKTNQGIFQAAGAVDSSGYLKDWKDGWAALARLAGGGNR
ncbi:MAG: hypothetical protein LBB44_04345 [Endomicrobium sp.]|nr:hypothetical protein [Endomicrobium sp.]